MTWTDIASGRSLDGTDQSTTAVLGACRYHQDCQVPVMNVSLRGNLELGTANITALFSYQVLKISLGSTELDASHTQAGKKLSGPDANAAEPCLIS